MALPQAGAAAVPAPRPVTLVRQLALCAAMCALACAILAIDGRTEALFAGGSIPWQLAVGAGLGGAAAINAWFVYRHGLADAGSRTLADGYGRLELAGWNPLWFAACAGLWEELLFRGALQPLIGLVPAATLFVLAHARAYRFRDVNRRVAVQAAGLFLAGIAFGLLVRYVGLLAAMIVHAAVDVWGLLTVRALRARAGRPLDTYCGARSGM
jgi:membrane protease YdiL (CAAX protease family)